MRAGEAQINASRGVFHAIKVGPDALSALPIFAGNLLFGRQYSRSSVEINIDIASLHFLDDAGNNFAFFCAVFVDDGGAFRFADFLNDDLLGCLRGDPSIIVFCFQGENYFIV